MLRAMTEPIADASFTTDVATFYESTGYATSEPVFRRIFETTGIVDLVRALYRGGRVY